MRRNIIITFCFLSLSPVLSLAQSISSSLPEKLSAPDQYLFYLHGGVVTVLGNNAVNQSAPEWGPYEYLNILDSLRRRGLTSLVKSAKRELTILFMYIKLQGKLIHYLAQR
jgi:hypothetical protein